MVIRKWFRMRNKMDGLPFELRLYLAEVSPYHFAIMRLMFRDIMLYTRDRMAYYKEYFSHTYHDEDFTYTMLPNRWLHGIYTARYNIVTPRVTNPSMGSSIEFIPTHKIKEICNYRDNMITGTRMKWYRNGRIRFIGSYINGKKEGLCEYYYDQENPYGKSIDKISPDYYGETTPYIAYNYHDGLLHGKQIVRYKSGITRLVARFRHGQRHGIIKRYYPCGQIRSEYRYLNDVANGMHNEWYNTGSLKSEKNFLNGVLHGIINIYHSNGYLYSSCRYHCGIRYGIQSYYYENGLRYLYSYYINGKLHGTQKKYNVQGQLIEIKEYCMGRSI